MTLSGEVSEGEAQYMYYVFKNKSLFTNNNQNKKLNVTLFTAQNFR